EIMIAIAVFGVLAVICYQTFGQTVRETEVIRDANSDLTDLQRTFQWLSNDFLQQQPRPVRTAVGNTILPSLAADSRTEFLFEITRGGHANPLGLPRASAQRVSWRMDEDTLVRLHWPSLDPVLSTEPIAVEFLSDIERIEINFLGDAPDSWTREWPGPSGTGRPRAVEIIIEHARFGEVRRLLETGY
ncbi:MAG: type II secretion system minor pseudopilin GspJ, partial [Pseudomonadota bacterium]